MLIDRKRSSRGADAAVNRAAWTLMAASLLWV
jgi:hypothetical protein